ncbi:MAG TPA: hypothetical protein VII28_13530 [Puia sp.]
MGNWKSTIQTAVVLLVVPYAPTKPVRAMAPPSDIGFDNPALAASKNNSFLPLTSKYCRILNTIKYKKEDM